MLPQVNNAECSTGRGRVQNTVQSTQNEGGCIPDQSYSYSHRCMMQGARARQQDAAVALCRSRCRCSRRPGLRLANGPPFHHPRNTALRTGTKLEEQAKHLRSVLMTPAESLGMRGTRKHTHTKKHEIVELHARAVALYNPHTPLFPKPA